MSRDPTPDLPAAFCQHKRDLIDAAFTRCERVPRSIADLGGVWSVDGAYAFYALETYDLDSVVIVDSDPTDAVLERCRATPRVEFVHGLFGDPAVVDRVGRVDAILLFDVLLHQVDPDWDELLAAYAPKTRCFVVANPQWVGGGASFRLLDLGRDGYFENVPHGPGEPGYDTWFDRLDEHYPAHRRRLRDVHYVWQWAITDADLRQAMAECGFAERVARNHGRFGDLERFERHGFVFEKV